MGIEYHYDAETNLIHTKPFGELSFAEVCEYFESAANDARIQPDCIEIVYFDEVENFIFNYREAESIVAAYHHMSENRHLAGTVFVARKDLSFGIARMLVALQDPDTPFAIIRDPAALNHGIAQVRDKHAAKTG